MLHDAGLSKKYWAFAVSLAAYLTNCTPTRLVVGMTTYEAWHGRKPFSKHLRVFGCLPFLHVPKEIRTKLDYSATPGLFVGYTISTKRYIVYDPLARTLHCSQDVEFRQGKLNKAPNAADEAILNEHFYRHLSEEPKPTKKQPTRDYSSEPQTEETLYDSPPDPPMPKNK
jgi:hypothetical protein